MAPDGIRLTANPFAPPAADNPMTAAGDGGHDVYPGEASPNQQQSMQFRQFVDLFNRVPLPRDNEQKDKVDPGVNFPLGDPIPLRSQDVPPYETRAQFGSVEWVLLFSHLISLRDQVLICDTVYLIVDDRDMSDLEATKMSIPHWPPAAAWWASRVPLAGPYCERTEVICIHIGEDTGLSNVHPTWAGTFVLAGMVALYPNIHFALIDNDCLPLTLFEIAELWNMADPHSLPLGAKTRGGGPTATVGNAHPHKRARRDPCPGALPPQGVILFTEPRSELNAGLVVVCASGHQPILDLVNLELPETKDAKASDLLQRYGAAALRGYRHLMKGYLATCLDPSGLSCELASTWIQTGLALTPFAFAETRFSVDWALAWALIGEWTIHHLFPPPKSGKWPRYAHVDGLEEGFHHRSPSLVTWARACFEQGALPSLSVLPGAVEIRSLPGDKMFQATHVVDGFQRPCVLHGYGGAKSSMPTSLPVLAGCGWTVLAAALLGTTAKPPLWTQDGFRPVIGTTIDTKIVPSPISGKEESLLLSRWWPAREASQARCLTTFLQGYEIKHSPSQAHVLTGLSAVATAPNAILSLLKDIDFPLWTLMQSPSRFDEVTDTLICFAFSSTSEGACLMAALSLHGMLPLGFLREAWNLAVGIWFKLGGTQRVDCPHRLFHVPAGQVALPLSIPLKAGQGRHRGFTREGREVPVTHTYQVSR